MSIRASSFGGVLAITFLAPALARVQVHIHMSACVGVCVCARVCVSVRTQYYLLFIPSSGFQKGNLLFCRWFEAESGAPATTEDRGRWPRPRVRARVSLLTFKMPHNGHSLATGWSLSNLYASPACDTNKFGHICPGQSFGQSICNSDDFYGQSEWDTRHKKALLHWQF